MSHFPHSIDIIPGVLLFEVAAKPSVETTRRIGETVRILRESSELGFIEIVPSYTSITVFYGETVDLRAVAVQTFSDAWQLSEMYVNQGGGNSITIDVVYGDMFGEDLTEVSEFTGIPVDDVITLHASAEYTVGAVGFAPGFTYLLGLPPELAVPRRSSPRLRVPPGSVGIGGSQTGVYALPSAGGWNLIGRSPTRLFDPESDDPVTLRLGDTVRFRPVSQAEFAEPARISQPRGDGPIEVVSPGLQTTMQDLGRYGHGASGLAPDGAGDRGALVAANRLLGNPDGAATLECTLVGPHLRFHRRMRFGLAGADLGARLNGRPLACGRAFETMPGDELTFQPDVRSYGARCYLAVSGGFDVPLVLGSASTNLTAGIGGWYGRVLLQGDRLSVGQRQIAESPYTIAPVAIRGDVAAQPFRVLPGPQRSRFSHDTWQRLVREPFTVSDDANRVGIRLVGPDLSPEGSADVVSEGMVTGSIQVTGAGQAIVMLPGRATIGGYTRIASVIAEDWDRLGQLVPGDQIRFTEFP